MVTFHLLSSSMELTAAGRGEKRAEVCCINQMAWHLNILPGGTPGLKDVKSDEWTCPRITSGAGERWACLGCTKQCPWHIHRKLIILPAAAGNTTGGRIIFAHNCPLSPELTSSKRSRAAALGLWLLLVQDALNSFSTPFGVSTAP